MFKLNGLVISHFIPGRFRVRIKQLKKNEGLAEQIRGYASGLELIDKVEVNTLTGSVLIEYNPDKKHELEQLFEQARQFNFIPEEMTIEQVHAILDGRESIGEHSHTLADGVASFFNRLNEQVKYWSGNNVTLQQLLPISLFGLGIRQLLTAENVMGPPWHAYFWYAFSTFFMFIPYNEDQNDKSSRNQPASEDQNG